MTTVIILSEHGFEEAALGLSLSYDREAANMPAVMARLFKADGGHNKFLESMMLWVDILAPRHFWQQFDTYRTLTKQSGSTMHTATRRPVSQDDFEQPIPPETLARLNSLIVFKDLATLKNELPEGYLQRRIVCLSYKTLRNIIAQRRTHRNKPWQIFCKEMIAQAAHPEFLEDLR